jgi:hypothetical protein
MQDYTGACVDFDSLAPAVGTDDLEPVDPPVGPADQVHGDDVAGSLGADYIQYGRKALDLAALVQIQGAIMVVVPIVIGTRSQRRSQDKSGKAQHRQTLQMALHRHDLSHVEAFNLLSVIISPQQATGR